MKHLLAFRSNFTQNFPNPAPPGHGQTYCRINLPIGELVNEDECIMRDLPVEYDCPDCKKAVDEGTAHVEACFALDRARYPRS